MDIDVTVLYKIAQDKVVVDRLEKAVSKGTLLVDCPFPGKDFINGPLCERLCWKIWPDLALDDDCPCAKPCSKPHRLEIAQAIIALSKLVPEPKTYRVGDCFSYKNGFALLVASPVSCVFLTNISNGCGSRVASPVEVEDFQVVSPDRLKAAFGAFSDGVKHLGHISELTIKNGKVVKG